MLSHLIRYNLFILDSMFLYLFHLCVYSISIFFHYYLFIESVYNFYFVKRSQKNQKLFLTSTTEVFKRSSSCPDKFLFWPVSKYFLWLLRTFQKLLPSPTNFLKLFTNFTNFVKFFLTSPDFVKLFTASKNFIKVAGESNKFREVVGEFYKHCKVIGEFY